MSHIPVLLEEVVEFFDAGLKGQDRPWLVDCTVGLGGHARVLLERHPGLRLLGLDRDPEALRRCRERLKPFGGRALLVQGNFHDLAAVWAQEGEGRPQGILADLGVSSMQLDFPERGFSFRNDGPLDMRMGDTGPTAGDIVSEYSETDLERIIKEYGEERMARRIARAIVEARTRKPLETTAQLREVIVRAKGSRAKEGRVDPATRTFQGLRIEVNQELAGLEGFIDQAAELLEAEGRLVVISYHSLEDRIVKHSLRRLSRGSVDPVTGRPREEERILEVLTRKPVRPGPAEVAANPRSRSARLRAARKKGSEGTE